MRLTTKERKLLTKALCDNYRKATKKGKGCILDEFSQPTGKDRGYPDTAMRGRRPSGLPKPEV